MKLVFQGSQKLHIRVAISFEALIGFQCLICQIIVHFIPHWPVYSDFMGTFLTPSSSLCRAYTRYTDYRVTEYAPLTVIFYYYNAQFGLYNAMSRCYLSRGHALYNAMSMSRGTLCTMICSCPVAFTSYDEGLS